MSAKLNDLYYNLFEEVIRKNSNTKEINSKFNIFINALVEFTSKEKRLFYSYRILKQIQTDMSIKRKSLDLTLYDISDRITALIDIEINIILLKLKNPDKINLDEISDKTSPELLEWTDLKINLIELAYSISKSINNGNASMAKIIRCFEYIFQVNLGNFYDTLGEINTQQGEPCQYLETLHGVLLKKMDEINSK